MTVPARASTPPATRATRILGRRMDQAIPRWCTSWSMTWEMVRLAEPMHRAISESEITATAHTVTKRAFLPM